MKIINIKKLHHKKILINSMIGMTCGFIATLVVGTIIGLLAINQNNDFSKFIKNIKHVLFYLCPFAIGTGIGFKSKLSALQILATSIACFIIGHSLVIPKFIEKEGILDFKNNDISINISINLIKPNSGDVFAAFLSGILMIYFFKIFKWVTLLDILIIPILGILIGLFGMLWITYLTSTILVLIEWIIYNSANKVRWAGILLSPFIGVIMGLALSLPTSSAAIAFAVSLKGDAATAAMAGTAAQMISFGILTYYSTRKISTSIAVGLGTSMLQMKNFFQRPRLLIIPVLISGITALLSVAFLPLKFPTKSVTSGMGTCGLYGQIFTLVDNGWTNYLVYLNVFMMQLLFPIISTFFLSYLLFKRKIFIKKEWLEL